MDVGGSNSNSNQLAKQDKQKLSSMPEYYHVRIKSSKNFDRFLEQITSTRQRLWDKDFRGSIQTGDYLGFITGPGDNACVHVYRVLKELSSSHRPSHWATTQPNTKGNGKHSVGDRDVIVLTDQHALPRIIEWSSLRMESGLGGTSSSWMPHGIERVKTCRKRLPFAHLL